MNDSLDGIARWAHAHKSRCLPHNRGAKESES